MLFGCLQNLNGQDGVVDEAAVRRLLERAVAKEHHRPSLTALGNLHMRQGRNHVASFYYRSVAESSDASAEEMRLALGAHYRGQHAEAMMRFMRLELMGVGVCCRFLVLSISSFSHVRAPIRHHCRLPNSTL